MTEAERSLGRRWFDEVWNKKHREAIAEMIGSETVLHDGDVVTKGPDPFYAFFDRMNAALSDLRIEVEDSFAEGDKLCLRWSCTARHTGTGLGPAPTGRQTRVTGISIMQIRGKHIVEAWQNWDMLGLMDQIGGVSKAPTYIAQNAELVSQA